MRIYYGNELVMKMPNLKILDECQVYKVDKSASPKQNWQQMKIFEHTQFKEKQISRLSSHRKNSSREVLLSNSVASYHSRQSSLQQVSATRKLNKLDHVNKSVERKTLSNLPKIDRFQTNSGPIMIQERLVSQEEQVLKPAETKSNQRTKMIH